MIDGVHFAESCLIVALGAPFHRWVYLDVDIYRRIGPTTICFLSAVRPVEPRRL
jgi:hypothetical protein